jgi:hypothetical protein
MNQSYQPITGPETIRLIDTKFGKFRNWSLIPADSTSNIGFFLSEIKCRVFLLPFATDEKSNPIGRHFTSSKSLGNLTTLRPKLRGFVTCESFQGGEERKRGPTRYRFQDKGLRGDKRGGDGEGNGENGTVGLNA